jgi:hypothetical protein
MKREIFKFKKVDYLNSSHHSKLKIFLRCYFLQTYAMVYFIFTKKELTHAFFYSQKQYEVGTDFRKRKVYFKGKEYSEMCGFEFGATNNWSDAKLLGFGSYKDISF